MLAACLQCQRQNALPCVGTKQEWEHITFHCGSWPEMHSDDILAHEFAKNQIGCRTVSLETFLPLWTQVRCPILVICLQCRTETRLRVFLEFGVECIQTIFWMWKCKRIRLVPEQSVSKPSTSMGAATLLMSLSHVGSLLAMPAPECPALCWHQKGMRIDYFLFWKLARNAFRRHFGTWNCNKCLQLSVWKPSYLYEQRYAVPFW